MVRVRVIGKGSGLGRSVLELLELTGPPHWRHNRVEGGFRCMELDIASAVEPWQLRRRLRGLKGVSSFSVDPGA